MRKLPIKLYTPYPSSVDKRQHLVFIQNTIARLSNYGKTIKIMTMTFLGAMSAYILKASHIGIITMMIYVLLALALWHLDTYYLCVEREMRKLYEKVASIKDMNEIDYKFTSYEGCTFCNYGKTFFSVTMWPLHVVSISIILLPIIQVFLCWYFKEDQNILSQILLIIH